MVGSQTHGRPGHWVLWKSGHNDSEELIAVAYMLRERSAFKMYMWVSVRNRLLKVRFIEP